MSVSYFTGPQRRRALRKWLRREFGNAGMFNLEEALGALDVFTPLYGPAERRRCSADLSMLSREGHLERVGSQWRLLPQPKGAS